MAFALELLALALGVVALILLVPWAPRRARVRRHQPAPTRPADLERIERLLTAETAADVHARLRPLLREIAQPLVWRRGVRLDREPERGRELLGPELWDLVRPDRVRPEDLRGPGLTPAQLEKIVSRLEAL